MFRQNHKRIAAALTLLAGALLGTGCHRFQRSPEAKASFINGRISSKLDLNDEQEAKLKAVSDEIVAFAKELKALRAQEHDELVALIQKPELDQERLMKGYNDRKARLEQRLPTVLNRLAELHKTLTPEQKTELLEALEKHQED